MRIKRVATDHDLTFQLFGDLEGLAARHVQRVLAGAVCDGSVVTVDLGGVESFDDSGAEMLASLTKRARDASGRLVLSSPSDELLRMLEQSGALPNVQPAP